MIVYCNLKFSIVVAIKNEILKLPLDAREIFIYKLFKKKANIC